MLIYNDKTPGGVHLIWDDDSESFISMRPESHDHYSETRVLEVTYTNYELIQYMEGHLDQQSAMTFAEKMKDKMSEEQYKRLLNAIASSRDGLRYKVIEDK